MSLADYQTLVTKLVRDDTGKIAADDRDKAIALAVQRYSQDRPRAKVADIVAAGSNLLDLPAGWESGFSVLRSLEYPIGNVPPSLLDEGGIQLYESPSAVKIMTASAIPNGESARATFSIRHTLDGATDTIPAHHQEAVATWAAGVALDQLASFFSGESDSTIGADAVNQRTKGQEFAARARTMRKLYLDALGVDDKRTVAAGAVRNLDLPDSLGRDRLTHPRRFR